MEHIYKISSSKAPIRQLSSLLKDANIKSKCLIGTNISEIDHRFIVLVCLDKHDPNIISAYSKIKSKYPEALVIYIGHAVSNAVLIELFRAGLNDFLIKPITQNDIDESIARVKRQIKTVKFDPNYYNLTLREAQVCGLLAKGLISKEIAHHLNLTPATIKVYKSRLFIKLKIRTIPDLMRKVLK